MTCEFLWVGELWVEINLWSGLAFCQVPSFDGFSCYCLHHKSFVYADHFSSWHLAVFCLNFLSCFIINIYCLFRFASQCVINILFFICFRRGFRSSNIFDSGVAPQIDMWSNDRTPNGEREFRPERQFWLLIMCCYFYKDLHIEAEWNGLVGQLVSWAGFEPSISRSSAMWSWVLMTFAGSCPQLWRLWNWSTRCFVRFIYLCTYSTGNGNCFSIMQTAISYMRGVIRSPIDFPNDSDN